MALANVNLTDTYDIWRTRTNQIIISLDQNSVVTNAAFAKANTVDYAFAKANSANYYTYLVDANVAAAFAKANTGGTITYAAFDKANAEPLAQTAYNQANAAFNQANSANPTAVAAFAKANAANISAGAAYDKANNAGGGYYIGNNGRTGPETGKNDIFRVNNNYINGNIYFNAGENASATGPLSVNVGYILQINTDARVIII